MEKRYERELRDGKEWYSFTNEWHKRRALYGNLLTIIFIIVLIVLGLILYNIVTTRVDLLLTSPCDLCVEGGWSCFPPFN